MSGPDLDTLKKKLWPHQTNAVKVIEHYLKQYNAGKATGSALVRLPTGTGKTGVIAVAARVLAASGLVVIVCPSTALRDQLHSEVDLGFWKNKLKVEVPRPQLAVRELTPSTLDDVLTDLQSKSGILVGTIQSLAQVHRTAPKLYQRLKQRVSLLIFDEGHREPARHWGAVARGLDCPSLLFSATPYRNDYALFSIDAKHVTTFSFQDALDFACIRDVDVATASFSDAKSFVSALETLLGKAEDTARAIVRCETKDAITDIVATLTSLGHHAVGIHDTYRSSDGAEFRSTVPDPNVEAARVWVHQYKLLEGIDDPRFSIVGIYNPFSNARSLVQQVGRVIRNPTLKPAKPAVLLVHPDQGQKEYWNQYLEFERSYDPGKHDVRDLIRDAVGSQPVYRYLDGDFRRVFDPYAPGFEMKLRVPRATNIYKLRGTWHPASLLNEIIAEWEDEDRVHLNSAQPDKSTIVVLYTDARNSPTLLRDYFIEDRLGFTIVHRVGEWLFYVDTGGALSETVRDASDPLQVSELHWLFGRETRAVSMSMRNTDFNRYAFRHRSVRAYSLLDAATGLADHGYFCSTAEGYDKSKNVAGDLRRYVGVDKSRLTETTPPGHDLAAFRAWARSKATELAKRGKPHNVFNRFAAYVAPPSNTTARHLLLDVAELIEREAYVTVNGGQGLALDDVAVPVTNDQCSVVANGTSYQLGVSYDQERQRYRLSCDVLDDSYKVADASDRLRRGLVSHLNVEQSFRIVPGEGWTIYAHGHFFKPVGVGTPANGGSDLLRIMTEVPALDATTSEKGDAGSAGPAGWSNASVFGVIDRCRDGGTPPTGATPLRDAMTGLDTVVCDDMNKETADFLCGDSAGRRLVLVHVKQNDSQRSASAFHEICGQAVKNLDLLMPLSGASPPNLRNWDRPWKASTPTMVNGQRRMLAIGDVVRIRRGPTNGAACWARLNELARSPDTQREVWIVLGKTFKISWLRQQRNKSKPDAEAVQLFYLLQSTWTAVSSVGARLRIFARP